jgi:membrane fusion protein (multidrug efflux system)
VSEAEARVSSTSAVEAQVAQAKAQAQVAHARVETAKAARDLAKLDWGYTKIAAPRSGVASRKSIAVGQMVSAGMSVVQIVPTEGVWVVANFKETQLDRVRAGQKAEIEIDAYPGLKLKGEVESLSGGTGSRFSLLPAENATGNFVKVVQRVPVRMRLAEAPQGRVLRPGMSANVRVEVNQK